MKVYPSNALTPYKKAKRPVREFFSFAGSAALVILAVCVVAPLVLSTSLPSDRGLLVWDLLRRLLCVAGALAVVLPSLVIIQAWGGRK